MRTKKITMAILWVMLFATGSLNAGQILEQDRFERDTGKWEAVQGRIARSPVVTYNNSKGSLKIIADTVNSVARVTRKADFRITDKTCLSFNLFQYAPYIKQAVKVPKGYKTGGPGDLKFISSTISIFEDHEATYFDGAIKIGSVKVVLEDEKGNTYSIAYWGDNKPDDFAFGLNCHEQEYHWWIPKAYWLSGPIKEGTRIVKVSIEQKGGVLFIDNFIACNAEDMIDLISTISHNPYLDRPYRIDFTLPQKPHPYIGKASTARKDIADKWITAMAGKDFKPDSDIKKYKIDNIVTLDALQAVSEVYAATKEEKYLNAAKQIFLGYTKTKISLGRPSSVFGSVAHSYDLIHNGLTPGERSIIKNYFRSSCLRGTFGYGIGNLSIASRIRPYSYIATALGDKYLLNLILNGAGGLCDFLTYGFNKEGIWFERCFAYQQDMIAHLNVALRWIKRAGVKIDVQNTGAAGMSIRKTQEGLALIAMPNGRIPKLNDTHGDLPLRGKGIQPASYSLNLPDSGLCILRSDAKNPQDQTYVFVDYAKISLWWHVHASTMQIMIYANGRHQSNDMGSVSEPRTYYPPYQLTWYSRPAAHCTMLIDHDTVPRIPCGGKAACFANTSVWKIADVETEMKYTDSPVYNRRTLIMDSSGKIIIDLFRACSDQKMTYDYNYHNRGKLSVDISLKPTVPLAKDVFTEEHRSVQTQRVVPLTGYGKVKEVKKGKADKQWQARWSFPDQHLLFTMLPVKGTELFTGKGWGEGLKGNLWIAGKGYGDKPEEMVSLIIARRKAKNTLYMSVIEPVKGKRVVTKITKIQSPDFKEKDGKGAFSIARDNGTMDYVLASYNREKTAHAAGFYLKGDIGLIQTQGKELKSVFLDQGTEIGSKGWTIQCAKITDLLVRQEKPETVSIKNLTKETRQITLQWPITPSGKVIWENENGKVIKEMMAKVVRNEISFRVESGGKYLVNLRRK